METIDHQLIDLPSDADTTLYKELPVYGMRIDKAEEREHEEVTFLEAAGRMSGEYIYIYPPGIPIVTPGEIISADIIKSIKGAIDKGLNVKGVVRKDEDYISVVKEDR